MFYDTFQQLCTQKGVSPPDVRKALKISQSTMSSWKTDGVTPRYPTLLKLSGYFGVSVGYLIGETETAAPDEAIVLYNSLPDALKDKAKDYLRYLKYVEYGCF